MSDSEESWGDIDFGEKLDLPSFPTPKPAETKNNTELFFEPDKNSDDDENWDDDFLGEEDEKLNFAPMKLKGIKANPNAVEDYDADEDFDLEDFNLDLKKPIGNLKDQLQDKFNVSLEALAEPKEPKLFPTQASKLTMTSPQLQFYTQVLEAFPKLAYKDETYDDQTNDEEQLSSKIEELTKQATQTTDPIKRSDIHFEIGLCYKKLTKNVKALGSLKAAKQMQTESGKDRPQFLINLLQEISSVQAETGDFFESIKTCEDILERIEEYKKKIKNLEQKDKDFIQAGRAKTQYQLAIAYQQTESMNKAAPFFAECIKENSLLVSSSYKLINWFHLGRAALQIGKWLSNEYMNAEKLAAEFIGKSVEASNQANDRETSSEATTLHFGRQSVSSSTMLTLESISNDEDSFDDWDADLGIDQTERVKIQIDVVNTTSASENVLIENKYKLLQATDVEILSFPKATFFFTLKTKEKHTYMEEEFLQKWLGSITKKHIPKLFINTVFSDTTLKNKNQYELKEHFHTLLESYEPYSHEWCHHHLEFCSKLYFLQNEDLFWSTASNFLMEIQTAPKKALDDDLFLGSVVMVTYLASKAWTKSRANFFESLLDEVERIHSNGGYLREIIETETQLHHCQKDFRKMSKPLKKLCELYKELSKKAQSTAPVNMEEIKLCPLSDTELSVRCLLSIHLTLIAISPLDFTPLDFSQCDDDDDEDLSSMHEKLSNLVHECGIPGNAVVRGELLNKSYSLIQPSLLKAKIAYILADRAILDLEDPNLAEQILFETNYILDLIGTSIPFLAPIVSELGTSSLIRYGEILLNNSKYPYAIAAMEQALFNFKLRKKPQGELLKNLAFLTQKNGDIERATNYFKEMLQIYEEIKKKNEARWVAETLCTMYAESGDFAQAEIYIQRALSLSGWDPVNPNEKVSPIVFRLQMKNAEVLLDSYKFEKGIELLESLVKLQLPTGTKETVMDKLAGAYIKKNMSLECTELLSGWQLSPKKDPKSVAQNLRLYQLSAKNEYHSRNYTVALFHTENAISICDSSNISPLADFYFLRGKIFQALCNSSTAIQFPTSLRPDKSPTNGSFLSFKLYSCTGDLIQDAVYCFDKAYDYYRVIGDDINRAKVLSRIGEVYLDRVFTPTSLLRFDYSEVSRLRGFSTGDLQSLTRRKGHVRTFSDSKLPDFVISHEKIEGPARIAMDLAADTANILLVFRTYLNMAELRYLQDRKDSALAFWCECKDLLFQLFFDGQEFIMKDVPPYFIRKILGHLRRLVRLLLAFETPFINKNLVVLDALLLLEIEHDHAFERPMKATKLSEEYKSFTLGKSTGRKSTLRGNDARASVISVFEEKPLSPKATNDSPESFHPKHPMALKDKTKTKNAKLSELGEKIWGLLAAIKVGVQKYSQGKIPSSELVSFNQKTLRKILQLRTKQDQRDDLFKSSHQLKKDMPLAMSRRDIMNQKETETYRIHIQQFTNRNFQKVLYALKIYDYLCFYAPLSGTKEILRFGGKQESLGAITPAPNTQVPLNIHLLARSEECVCLETSSTTSLDSILKFLTNTSYWKEPSSKRASSFFFSKSAPSAQKSGMKYVSETDDFLKYLNKLLGELGYAPSQRNDEKVRDKPLSVNELESISFSKKTIDEFNSTQKVVPLLVNSHTTVAQCFTERELNQASEENPLRLFLYLATNPIDFKLPLKNQAPVAVTEEVVSYLASLIKDTAEEVDPKKTLQEFNDKTFTLVNKMTLHDTENTNIEGALPPTYTNATRKKISNACPISLIASKSLQLLPWEIFLSSLVVRFISAQEIINCAKASSVVGSETNLPSYYAIYHSLTDKTFQQEQEKRKEWLIQEMTAKLHGGNSSPSSIRHASPVSLLHNPLIKPGKKPEKTKFKHIQWIDTSFLTSPIELQMLIDETHPPLFSVFLLSHSDLISFPSTLYLLMKSKPQYVFLFAPSNKMKAVSHKLMKYQEDCIKQKGKKSPLLATQGRFHLLMSIVTQIQDDIQIPICVFNLYKSTD